MGEAGAAADKGTILSNLLREMNSTAVKSHTSNSQINIFIQEYLTNSEAVVFLHETSIYWNKHIYKNHKLFMASSGTEKEYPLHKNYCCKIVPFLLLLLWF